MDATPEKPLRGRLYRLVVGVLLPGLVVAGLVVLLSGDDSAVETTVLPESSLTTNPSFESGNAGWVGQGAGLSLQEDEAAPHGGSVARLEPRQAPRPYSLADRGRTVRSAAAGQVYTARAFVRAGVGDDGKIARLTVREWDGDRVVDSESVALAMSSTAYTGAAVPYTALSDGDQLEVVLNRDTEVSAGEVVYVDAISLTPAEVLFSDTGEDGDPGGVWGRIDCQETSRQRRVEAGGDPAPDAGGAPQESSAYRRLTVRDGDDISGERCELGENDHNEGPTALYREGRRILTFVSLRVPSTAVSDGESWQTVFQIKQAQPSDGGEFTSPVLAMHVTEGEWRLDQVEKGTVWRAPVTRNRWTRFVLDGVFSQDADLGSVRLHADLNADGDFLDAGEHAEVRGVITLGTEVDGENGGEDGLDPGDSIPGHLRVGIYHCDELPGSANACPEPERPDPWPCPAPPGRIACAIDVDNVQVAIVSE